MEINKIAIYYQMSFDIWEPSNAAFFYGGNFNFILICSNELQNSNESVLYL